MDEVATAAQVVQSADLSVGGLFIQADWLIKLIVLGLAVASFWTWTIIFHKWWRVKRLRAKVGAFEKRFQQSADLRVFYEEEKSRRESGLMHDILAALMSEHAKQGANQLRLVRVVDTFIAREVEKLEKQMVFLASVGSSAPFIGLLGTVWGIMSSFQSIGVSKNTSLAVVAPGIAEALFATALGLVAAIPAVIAYNKFNNDISRIIAKARVLGEELLFILK